MVEETSAGHKIARDAVLIDQEDPVSELHDGLERARTALKKEPITDELVVACEHILSRPDLPISTPDVHLPPLDNAGTVHLSRYRTTRRLKDLERRQETVEQGPFGSPERFSYLSVEKSTRMARIAS